MKCLQRKFQSVTGLKEPNRQPFSSQEIKQFSANQKEICKDI